MKKYLLSNKAKIMVVLLLVACVSGIVIFYELSHKNNNYALAGNVTSTAHTLNKRIKTANCKVNGPLPDAACTPGAVQTTDINIICFQSTKMRRNVTAATSNKVYKEYNIIKPVNNTGKNQKYEVDHLIPLELGGSNDIANLFPEAASPTPGFREKDKVENYLHKLVCSGSMSIAEAQYGVATNWFRYYQQLTTGVLPEVETVSTLVSTTTTTTTTVTIIISTSTSIISTSPLITTPSTLSSEPQVKKSSTGICHEKGTTYYGRTTNYTPYNSIQECLDSGGRLPLK